MSGGDDNTGPGHAASTLFSRSIGPLGPALWLLVLFLALGLGAVAWSAKDKSESAHALARSKAREQAASLELQLKEAFAAVDSLGLLVRQSGGAPSNFQKLGTELVSAHPVLAFVELEPGGVVSQVAPAPGHERIVGLNIWKNAAQSPGARAALQHRVLTADGPFTLDHGESGIVARVPIFPLARDGHEYFWGFVAGSARLSAVLARAGLDTLRAEGYDFALDMPGSGARAPVRIASQGRVVLDGAVSQTVRAQNLEFRLALRPQQGWVNLGLVALEFGAVLAASLALYRILIRSQAGLLAVEAEKQRSHQSEQRLAEEKAEHARTRRQAKEEAEGYQSKLNQADSQARELQSQLGDAVRAAAESAQTMQTKLGCAQDELQQGRQKLQELETRLENVSGAERKTVADARIRLEQDRVRMADLQNRLDRANQTAESHAASLKALQKTNEDLQQRLLAAEERASQLKATLDQTIETHAKSPPPAALSAAPQESNPPAQEPPAAVERPPKGPATKSGKAGRSRRDHQMDLFAGARAAADPVAPQPEVAALEIPETPAQRADAASATQLPPKSDTPETRESASKSKPDRPVRRPPDLPPANPAQLRRAVNEILPLLTDQDPGARDCLAANRTVFRSAFSDEAYAEFEHSVKNDDYGAALEQLKRTARKHGIAL